MRVALVHLRGISPMRLRYMRAWQEPFRTSRKTSVPPRPRTASQYVLFARTATRLRLTRFHDPALGEDSFPDATSFTGCPLRLE
jgi:hypothetical protein